MTERIGLLRERLAAREAARVAEDQAEVLAVVVVASGNTWRAGSGRWR